MDQRYQNPYNEHAGGLLLGPGSAALIKNQSSIQQSKTTPFWHQLRNLFNAPFPSHFLPITHFKPMAATPTDVKELPNAYVFVIDMPGLKADQIKVQVEEGNVLVVSGERREKEKDQGVKHIKMERRLGKYLMKFVLPENADTSKISAVYQDGVLTVTVEKKPPPEPKQVKTIEVQVAGQDH